MWIERAISGLIESISAERPAILQVGARQTGKYSLLQRLFPDHHYVSLDVPIEARQASENGQLFSLHFTVLADCSNPRWSLIKSPFTEWANE
ncbi:MAG: hypothetical protein V3V31_08715 [Methylococcales bacterium]